MNPEMRSAPTGADAGQLSASSFQLSGSSRKPRAESRKLLWLDWFILLSVGLLSSAWCLTAARQLGPTFDEPFYIVEGLDYWRTGDRRDLLLGGVMPLSTHMQTLPLWIVERFTGREWVWARDVGEMLAITRAANLIFLWLFLFYAMRLGHAIGGPWTGWWSVMLLGFEPNFLAHTSLATTDMSLAACLLIFVYYFREGRTADWRRRVALPGVLLALPMLAKASAIVFAPLAMVLVEIERLSRDGDKPSAFARSASADGIRIFSIGFALAMLYCWTGGYGSFQTILANMPMDHPIRPIFAWFANLPLFPNGLYAIWNQITHNVEGHRTYLIGYDDAESLWFYLPVMMAIKLPLATLLLVAASFAVPGWRWQWALGFGGVLVAIALMMRVDVGIRLLLPVVAFVVIVAVARLSKVPKVPEVSGVPSVPGVAWSRRLATGGLAFAVSWLAWSDLRIWPDAIRYTNELWGNTDRGYLYVSDSNYDWGQGLPELAQWQQERSAPVTVWYFGLDPRYPDLVRFDPAREDPATRVPKGGYFAVGTTWVYGGYSRAVRPFVMHLRSQTPVARTRTFLIFDRADP
jgi:hypothetical protein